MQNNNFFWGKLRNILLLILLANLQPVIDAYALNMRPETTLDDELIVLKEDDFSEWVISDWSRKLIKKFTEPVHEVITNQAWGCKNNHITDDPNQDDCSPGKIKGPNIAPAAVMAGVQWNDNPYFQLLKTSLKDCRNKYVWLPTEPVCWVKVFKRGEKDARKGAHFSLRSGDVLLLRSHFGDLQFIHSMRSSDGESSEQTRDNILMWAEFMWKAAVGKYDRGTTIADIEIPALKKYFYPSDTMQRIFFRGNPTYVDKFPEFAFGSLLHMVQDSFSASHVLRETEGSDGKKCDGSEFFRPARIIRFENYIEQDSNDHAQSDTYLAMRRVAVHDPSNVVGVSQTLRQLVEKKADWSTEVKPYLQCVYELAPKTTGNAEE